jgi:DNA-directed RNA polymerase subunit M/transcription elongation factor TFIIS
MDLVKHDVRRRLVCALASVAGQADAELIEGELYNKVVDASSRFYCPSVLYGSQAVNLIQLARRTRSKTKTQDSLRDSCRAAVDLALKPPQLDWAEPADQLETDEQKLARRGEKMDSVLGKRSAAPATNPCPKCGFGDTSYKQEQIAHEDPTAKFYCPSCTHTWSRR